MYDLIQNVFFCGMLLLIHVLQVLQPQFFIVVAMMQMTNYILYLYADIITYVCRTFAADVCNINFYDHYPTETLQVITVSIRIG